MVGVIYKPDKKYLLFDSFCFGINVYQNSLLEDPANYPFIYLKDKRVLVFSESKFISLRILADIIEELDKIDFNIIIDVVLPRLRERLSRYGIIDKRGGLLDSLFIAIDNDKIYNITRSMAVIDINRSFICDDCQTAHNIESSLYLNRDKEIHEIIYELDKLIGCRNDIRRPPYFLCDISSMEVERIDL